MIKKIKLNLRIYINIKYVLKPKLNLLIKSYLNLIKLIKNVKYYY